MTINLLSTSTVTYVDDNKQTWRFTVSAMNVIARGMYEQMYLTAARDWYIAAIGKKPEDVIAAHAAARKKEEVSRQLTYEFNLSDRVYAWAMILASLTHVEQMVSGALADGTAVWQPVEIPDGWRTPVGMMETMKGDLFFELSFQAYRHNTDVLFDADDDQEKKRGVIRSS